MRQMLMWAVSNRKFGQFLFLSDWRQVNRDKSPARSRRRGAGNAQLSDLFAIVFSNHEKTGQQKTLVRI